VGVLGAAALGFGAFLLYRRRKKNQVSDDDPAAPSSPTKTELQQITIGLGIKKKTDYLKDIEIKEVIGSGSFGEVYRGIWKGSQQVALKKLKVDKMSEFLQEASMLQKCSFPNVVTFIGLYQDKEVLYMVTEYMSGGALNTLLQNEGGSLSVKTLVEMAKEAVSGVQNMSNMGLVHRDLAARNLLVHKEDGKYIVKVADFGLARHLTGNYYTSTTSMFPIKWSAPEVLKFEKFSAKSDVWSFGIVLWEIFEYGKDPYFEYSSNKDTVEAVLAGHRLSKPDAW